MCKCHVHASCIRQMRNLRKRAGRGSMSAPLFDVTRWQQLSPVPDDVTDNNDVNGPQSPVESYTVPYSDLVLFNTHDTGLIVFIGIVYCIGNTLHLSNSRHSLLLI